MDRSSYHDDNHDHHHHRNVKSPSQRLDNIKEEEEGDDGTGWLPTTLRPPETPTETMEFLARSWSLSAFELSRALGSGGELVFPHSAGSAPPSLISDEKIHPTTAHSSKPITLEQISPPISPMDHTGELMRGKKTKGHGWLKDHKDKRRAEARSRSAQAYAAASVAGVAAGVAAVAAASNIFSTDDASQGNGPSSKLGAAVASAAALVASHFVEMAQVVGASRDQILTVIRSSVNAQTAGDIMTLTARAATALRGAAILRARLHKEIRGTSSAIAFVSNGGELLKRTRKGILHWKQVSIYINSSWQVVVKMKSTHMAGTFLKNKKGVVTDVCSDISAWPGREDGGGNQRAYFGIKTPGRLIEFECRNKFDKQIWIEGIRQMLNCRASVNISMSM